MIITHLYTSHRSVLCFSLVFRYTGRSRLTFAHTVIITLLYTYTLYQLHRSVLSFTLWCFDMQDDDPQQRLLIETIKIDRLREIERERKATAEKTILTAAKLIAPVIEPSFAMGFDW